MQNVALALLHFLNRHNIDAAGVRLIVAFDDERLAHRANNCLMTDAKQAMLDMASTSRGMWKIAGVPVSFWGPRGAVS